MSDKYQNHLIIIPEDDHNRQIINGFVDSYYVPILNQRRIQVVGNAGGWDEAVKKFEKEYLPEMGKYSNRHVLIVLDFDGMPFERLAAVKKRIPSDCADRVFFLGTKDEPKDLKAAHKLKFTYEEIGRKLAEDFVSNGTTMDDLWQDEHLVHNLDELGRLCGRVRGFIFGDS